MDEDIDIHKYKERIDYELAIAEEADFSGYLLSVADYVAYARSKDCRTSTWLCCRLDYCLSTWHCRSDGIKHNLDPDRFIAKGRKSYPDYLIAKEELCSLYNSCP